MSDRRNKDLGSPESTERRAGPPRRRELSKALGETVVQWDEERRERERLEEENAILEQERYIDSLTGLYNARAFNEKLEELVGIAHANDEPLALLFVDGDGLHELNRIEGKAAGDNLIKTIAINLQTTARQTDMVARLGGDEYAVAMTGYKPIPGVSENELNEDTIARYKKALESRATLGIAILQPEDTAEELLAKADAACTANKPSLDRRRSAA